MVRHLVRHAAEHEALHARHAAVADDDEVGADLLGDVDRARRRDRPARDGSRTSRPPPRPARRRVPQTCGSRPRCRGSRSSTSNVGAPAAAACAELTRRHEPVRVHECSVAPLCAASSMAFCTAALAVSEPSVPTTITSNDHASDATCSRGRLARWQNAIPWPRSAKICLALPEVAERLSHGAPTFFVRDKKTLATVWDDHHGDGILGLDLRGAAGRATTARRRGTRAVLRAGVRRRPRVDRRAPRPQGRLGRDPRDPRGLVPLRRRPPSSSPNSTV